MIRRNQNVDGGRQHISQVLRFLTVTVSPAVVHLDAPLLAFSRYGPDPNEIRCFLNRNDGGCYCSSL